MGPEDQGLFDVGGARGSGDQGGGARGLRPEGGGEMIERRVDGVPLEQRQVSVGQQAEVLRIAAIVDDELAGLSDGAIDGGEGDDELFIPSLLPGDAVLIPWQLTQLGRREREPQRQLMGLQ